MSLIVLTAALAFAAPRDAPAPPAPPASSFESRIKPILFTRCTPCHVPGGKMYAKLPFDDPQTVRAHPEGVLKRLKGDDKTTVEAWLKQPEK